MEFDSPNEFKYHMIEMLIILIGSFILLGQYEYLFNNERYYKEYEFLLIFLVLSFNIGERLGPYSLIPILFVFSICYFMFWYLMIYMLEDVNDKINEKYFYKINDDELDYINDILYERKEFKKKYEIIKKGSNRYIDYYVAAIIFNNGSEKCISFFLNSPILSLL